MHLQSYLQTQTKDISKWKLKSVVAKSDLGNGCHSQIQQERYVLLTYTGVPAFTKPIRWLPFIYHNRMVPFFITGEE